MSTFEEHRDCKCIHGAPIGVRCEWCEREQELMLNAHGQGQNDALAEIVQAIRERATYLRDAGHDEATVMTTANVATWLAYGEWRKGRT